MHDRAILFFIGIFVLLTTLFSLRYLLVGQAVYGDGIYYWAYTRSIVIDRNLDLRNEGGHMYAPDTNNTNQAETFNDGDDLKNNKHYPFGVSLVWLLPFAAIHVLLLVLKLFFASIVTNGYADSYQLWIGTVNVCFVIVGMYISWKALQRLFSRKIALITVTLALFATNLIYYAGLDVINTHAASYLFTSLFVYQWLRTRSRQTSRRWLFLGFLLGLIAMIRPQDAFYGLLLVFDLPTVQKQGRQFLLSCSFLACLGFSLGYLPEIVVSWLQYHKLLLPYMTEGIFFDFTKPKLLAILFDTERGLIFFAPLYLIGITGLFLLPSKIKTIKLPFLSVVLAEIALISIWSG